MSLSESGAPRRCVPSATMSGSNIHRCDVDRAKLVVAEKFTRGYCASSSRRVLPPNRAIAIPGAMRAARTGDTRLRARRIRSPASRSCPALERAGARGRDRGRAEPRRELGGPIGGPIVPSSHRTTRGRCAVADHRARGAPARRRCAVAFPPGASTAPAAANRRDGPPAASLWRRRMTTCIKQVRRRWFTETIALSSDNSTVRLVVRATLGAVRVRASATALVALTGAVPDRAPADPAIEASCGASAGPRTAVHDRALSDSAATTRSRVSEILAVAARARATPGHGARPSTARGSCSERWSEGWSDRQNATGKLAEAGFVVAPRHYQGLCCNPRFLEPGPRLVVKR